MKNKFEPVFNQRNQRVRGLWKRNGTFYARLRVEGSQDARRFPLQAETVNSALKELQDLKTDRRRGVLKASPAQPDRVIPSLSGAIPIYQAWLEKMQKKRENVQKHELCSLGKFQRFNGSIPLDQIDRAFVHKYAEWRKGLKKRDGKPVCGRTVDLEIVHLRNLLKKFRDDGALEELPKFDWTRLGQKSKRKRLLTESEIDLFCDVALRMKRIGQQFVDYIRLLQFSGMREKEATRLKWDDIDWKNRRLAVVHTGVEESEIAVDDEWEIGVTKNSQTRYVDFNDRLESLLREMHAKRAPGAAFLFPAARSDASLPHTKSFKAARYAALKQSGVKRFGFHHLRHYFISWCVMSKIDYMTIAAWVGHQDGGVLIGKVYGHLNDEHKREQAKQLRFGSNLIKLENAA